MITRPFTLLRSVASVSLGLALVACGPQSVTPADDASSSDAAVSDGAAPADGATPGLCSAAISLFDSDADSVWTMDFAAAQTGYVSVISTRAGAVFAQAYDRNWAPVGARLALPSERTVAIGAREQPTVAFEAERGAVTFGSSVHEITISPTLELSLVRSFVAEQGGTRYVLLGAWPRTDDLGRLHVTAITTDGSVWEAADGRFGRVAASTQDARFYDAAVLFPTTYNDYVAFINVPQRDVNNNVRIRSFVPGHGMLLPSADQTERGSMTADPVRVGDTIWRLHHQNVEQSMRLAEEFSLSAHNPMTGQPTMRVPLAETALITGGALASREGNTDIERVLVTWTRMDRSGGGNELVAQWGSRGTRTTLHRSTLSPVAHRALIDASDARGWVVYGLYEQSSSPRRRVFAQCFAR